RHTRCYRDWSSDVCSSDLIFRKMTVEQNIMAILETLPISKAERKNRCEQLLHQFGIERIAKNQALTLSGGEKRRLTIARSLVTRSEERRVGKEGRSMAEA